MESNAYRVVIDDQLVDTSTQALVGYVLRWAPLPSVRLSVAAGGDGFGTVTSDSGIDCSGDFFTGAPPAWVCADPFNPGDTVTLTAAPRTTVAANDSTCTFDSVFDGWSGPACSGTDSCTLTLDSDTTVSPSFLRLIHVQALKGGAGGTGTVTATGIDCGSDCDEILPSGTMITVTAVPDGIFEGWWVDPTPPNQPTPTCGSDADHQIAISRMVCSGTATTCNLTLDATMGLLAQARADFQ